MKCGTSSLRWRVPRMTYSPHRIFPRVYPSHHIDNVLNEVRPPELSSSDASKAPVLQFICDVELIGKCIQLAPRAVVYCIVENVHKTHMSVSTRRGNFSPLGLSAQSTSVVARIARAPKREFFPLLRRPHPLWETSGGGRCDGRVGSVGAALLLQDHRHPALEVDVAVRHDTRVVRDKHVAHEVHTRRTHLRILGQTPTRVVLCVWVSGVP